MATYSGIKKIKIGDNIFELAVDWSDITNQPTIPTNTDKKLEINSVISGTTYYPIVATDSTDAATRQYDKNGFTYSVYRNASSIGTGILTLGNDKASGTGDNVQGKIILFGNTIYSHTIEGAPTSPRTITLPDKTGTMALTSDVPTKTSDLTNDSGFISSYTDENLKWTASTSSGTYYPLQSTSTATTSTANTVNSVSFYQNYNTAGGYRRLTLGNAAEYTSTGGAYGTIRLYGAAATYYGDLVPGVLSTSNTGRLTANRIWTLPDKTGTVALTSDIPTQVSDLTNDSGFITGVTSTSTPTANTIAEFNSSARMNSTDMEVSEISDFISNLELTRTSLIDIFYPVGSYYETSDTSFDPNVSWGGTWSLETEGSVHIGAGSNYTIGSTGGEATHTLTTDEMPNHNHTYNYAKAATDSHTLTTTQIPAHTHGSKTLTGSFSAYRWDNGATSGIMNVTANTKNMSMPSGTNIAHTSYNVVATHEHTSVGGGGGHTHNIGTRSGNTGNTGGVNSAAVAHNNMPPYIVVNRWHRTA